MFVGANPINNSDPNGTSLVGDVEELGSEVAEAGSTVRRGIITAGDVGLKVTGALGAAAACTGSDGVFCGLSVTAYVAADKLASKSITRESYLSDEEE